MRENTFNIMMALFGLSFFSGWIYLMLDSNSHPPKPENLEYDEDPSKTWKLFEVNFAFTIIVLPRKEWVVFEHFTGNQ